MNDLIEKVKKHYKIRDRSKGSSMLCEVCHRVNDEKHTLFIQKYILPIFIRFLKEQNVYEKFVSSCIRWEKDNHQLPLFKRVAPINYIIASFRWDMSYSTDWLSIHRLWGNFLIDSYQK